MKSNSSSVNPECPAGTVSLAEAPTGGNMTAQGNALGGQAERSPALNGRHNDAGEAGPEHCLALSGLMPIRGRPTQGVAVLCPGLAYPGLSGLKQVALIPHLPPVCGRGGI